MFVHSSPSTYLSLNAGSSSIRFALYREDSDSLLRIFFGKIDRIGLSGSTLVASSVLGGVDEAFEIAIEASDQERAGAVLMEFLEEHIDLSTLSAIGHRVVHGMNYSEHMRITDDVMRELHRISSFAPEHLPQEIALIECFLQKYPALLQVACFDTVFHHRMPRVAQLLPIPRRFEEKGIRRYGFHGLSYASIKETLSLLSDGDASKGNVIIAHLGNGASLAALQDGKSIDTSMGLTPLGGIPMSTRPGDIDPGVVWMLVRDEHLSSDELNDLLNHQSGLLGMSEVSSNMRDLLEREATDTRAKEAIAVFCYQTKKYIGAYAAALGGLDTLVFSGGIGENSAVIRSRICEGLAFLGVEIDEAKNSANNSVISQEGSRVTVRVIPTNEELEIVKTARYFSDILARGSVAS